jgi:hypothetical protein
MVLGQWFMGNIAQEKAKLGNHKTQSHDSNACAYPGQHGSFSRKKHPWIIQPKNRY